MTYQQVIQQARGQMGPCKACPVCDGKGCRGTIPGPGAKGIGDTAIRNYNAWQAVRLNMDTICASGQPDTRCSLLGQQFSLPVFAGPVGAVQLHYGQKYNDIDYNDILVPTCREAGILAFTGDGADPAVMVAACGAVKQCGGFGIPTVKPWDAATIAEKMALVRDARALAVAMDIDAAGLPFLKNHVPPAGSKTVAELGEIIAAAGVPFLIKGIMTVRGAQKALEAGAAGIVVSNHGGRVLDGTPATAEVLPEIAAAVGGRALVLVDGGIRTGLDVFRALALGADAVLIARPFVTAVYGAGADGVRAYVAQLQAELADAMSMCGARSLADISRDMVRL
ncbi:MAG: alpha-hydroxy-acid oxidizing protein [Gemmiger sp.]